MVRLVPKVDLFNRALQPQMVCYPVQVEKQARPGSRARARVAKVEAGAGGFGSDHIHSLPTWQMHRPAARLPLLYQDHDLQALAQGSERVCTRNAFLANKLNK